MFNVHRNHKAYWGREDREVEGGGGGYGGVSKYTWYLMSTETTRLIKEGRRWGYGGGGRGRL